jgi:general secretion pathway protein J
MPPRSLQWLSSGHRGFTLVEVLVALLILSVMAMIGWQGVSGMTRARQISQEASERSLRLTAIVGQWEHDLQAVYDSPQVPGLSFDGSALRLVRRTDDGVQVVVWSLREGVWQRWSSPAVTRSADLQATWLRSQQLPAGDARQLRLLDGIAEWQVYFWRGQGWSNAQSSGDVAAPPSSGASAAARTLLPGGVRLQIELPEGRLSRDVMLSPQSS